MKKLVAIALLLSLLTPFSVLAVFNTQSALLASASTQYFTRADTASLSITGNVTAEAWVKFTTLPSAGSAAQIVGKFDSASAARSWRLEYDNGNSSPGNALAMYGDLLGDNTVNVYGYTSWTPSTGVWYHVAGVLTVGATPTVALYIDGVSQSITYTAQLGVTAIFDGNNNTALGALNTGGTPALFLNGRLSLVRVWSEARSGANISANMCNVLGSTTNLAAEWTLDNTLNDNSGNANTLTNVNTVTFGTDIPSACVPPPQGNESKKFQDANIRIINGNFRIID